MKYLFMILSTVIWISIGFVLSNTLYAEGRRIIKDGAYYVVIDANEPTKIVMNKKWQDPSRIVY